MLKENNYSTKDNYCSHFLQIPQSSPAVEEIQKWRCTKMNNGEHEHDERECDSDSVSSGLVSPQQQQIPTTTTTGEGWCRRLSENNEEQKTPQKTFSTKLSAQQQQQIHPRIFRTFLVRLAEESPKRNNSADELSDSSTYDSFNCRETDVCRDSSDTESNSSFSSGEIGATIKVVEYEVASASNSEDLFTNDSSSGTDDFILAAVARAICNTSKCSSDFADTEEDSTDTDTTYDSEFSLADYWVCVKCKNKQNNPMFRYCEKCYQIRKTHFPPRPRLRKSRTTVKQQRSSQNFSSLKRSATTSEVVESLTKKRKQDDSAPANSSTTPSSSSSNSLPNSSSVITSGRLAVERSHDQFTAENSSSDDDNNASHFKKKINNISEKRTISEETQISKYLSSSTGFLSKLNVQKPAQHLRTAAKRKLSKAPSKYKALAKRKCFGHNSMPSSSSGSEIETDIVLSQTMSTSNTQSTQKDSGFSSAPSSQERKSSSEHQNEEDEDEDCVSNCGSNEENSDTVCDELSESDVAEMSQENNNCIPSTLEFDLNSQENSLGRHASDISLQTNTESHAISTLVQSVSECSDAYTNIQTSNISEIPGISTIEEKLRSQKPVLGDPSENGSTDFQSYGSCMTCLTEPKNGVFVHSRFLHLCCCYKCAVKIWNKNKKCPICNCAVKNVMKLFIH
ncbi:E3 ubiquitin-protein ligase Mdm2-like isoform X2 [Episyrphus balteatus]|uniref:E3 ubiquitin-protein ligase Mdm2-like isoform X2 n=1 Tax=Episyrphus balteatus TaxID=286459 RepID=UPI0024867519|nr:E3 ubiquitin-protein ligase Mdm2-like isoform X2 [Episyrphus balteatus]